MAFEWLDRFERGMPKRPGYAEKTLAAYARGMKEGHGSIVGVAVKPGSSCCDAAARLDPGEVHEPASAPRLPLPGCTRGAGCTCLYRLVMRYARAGT
jgi:hypothetical protein